MVKYSKEINSNIANKAGHISTQTRGDVCICTLYPPKYLAFAHRITPNIKDWFGCSDHPTHKSTNSYPDPDHEKVVNVDDNGDHEKGVNSGDNGVHEEGFITLIMT